MRNANDPADYDRTTSLPDFFATVTHEVAEVRIIVDGEVFASFDTSEQWWRQDMAEANGRVFLAGLTEDTP
jgi:hypothetical protein